MSREDPRRRQEEQEEEEDYRAMAEAAATAENMVMANIRYRERREEAVIQLRFRLSLLVDEENTIFEINPPCSSSAEATEIEEWLRNNQEGEGPFQPATIEPDEQQRLLVTRRHCPTRSRQYRDFRLTMDEAERRSEAVLMLRNRLALLVEEGVDVDDLNPPHPSSASATEIENWLRDFHEE